MMIVGPGQTCTAESCKRYLFCLGWILIGSVVSRFVLFTPLLLPLNDEQRTLLRRRWIINIVKNLHVIYFTRLDFPRNAESSLMSLRIWSVVIPTLPILLSGWVKMKLPIGVVWDSRNLSHSLGVMEVGLPQFNGCAPLSVFWKLTSLDQVFHFIQIFIPGSTLRNSGVSGSLRYRWPVLYGKVYMIF